MAPGVRQRDSPGGCAIDEFRGGGQTGRVVCVRVETGGCRVRVLCWLSRRKPWAKRRSWRAARPGLACVGAYTCVFRVAPATARAVSTSTRPRHNVSHFRQCAQLRTTRARASHPQGDGGQAASRSSLHCEASSCLGPQAPGDRPGTRHRDTRQSHADTCTHASRTQTHIPLTCTHI